MRPLFLSCLFIFGLAIHSAVAQNPQDTMHFWHFSGLTEVNFNQARLSNWQGGGQNTIAGAGFLHFKALYGRKKDSWLNKFDAGYGIIRLGDKTQPFQKSDDELNLLSVYGRSIDKKWNFFASLNFKTTFTPGYQYGKDSLGNPVRQAKLSEFMSPGYLLIGAGIQYKPSEVFFANISPIMGRATFITNDSIANSGAFGVPAGSHFRAQVGEDLKLGLKLPVMKNVLIESTLDLFGSYKKLSQQVVDWPVDITFKVNSLFTAKVGTHLVYDQDVQVKRDNGSVGPAVQFKEVIALGIQYKLY